MISRLDDVPACCLTTPAIVRSSADRAKEKQKMLDTFRALGLLPDWFPRSADRRSGVYGRIALRCSWISWRALRANLMVLNQEDLFKDTGSAEPSRHHRAVPELAAQDALHDRGVVGGSECAGIFSDVQGMAQRTGPQWELNTLTARAHCRAVGRSSRGWTLRAISLVG